VKMQSFVHLVSEDFFSVFGYKDQMQIQGINKVSFCSQILHMAYIFSIFRYICQRYEKHIK
jgi:hypothetical protein